MLISVAWLKELVPLDAGAPEIARRLTARGLTVDAVTASGTDTVLDIDVPANRPDALGHLGVAREAAAAFGVPLAARAAPPAASGAPVSDAATVTIEAPDLCGRFTAGLVRGVTVAPSSPAVVRRLEACGLRSINNVVDASNLVMLELGQPVHFFDLARLDGAAIRVRRASPGERLTTLDGVDRTLDPDMLVIADARRGIGLGGVIGGSDTEIRESTRDVLIEAASFAPSSIRRTARALGVSTDASQRFERGVDAEAPPIAQRLAARLLAAWAGGAPAPGMIDVRPRPASSRALSLRLSRATRLLGYAPSPDEALAALAALGLEPRVEGDLVHVVVPSWRVDLEREADLVEEIARHLGYDRIPSRSPASAPRPAASAGTDLEERVRDRLSHLGFAEALTYAMIGAGDDAPFVDTDAPAAIVLANPIAETLAVLRRSIAPALLRSADQNVRRGTPDTRLFEVGRVFRARGAGELPDEPLHVALAWTGSAGPAHWSAPSRATDTFDLAGAVDDILDHAGAGLSLSKHSARLPALHPGRSVEWRNTSGKRIAWCGPTHPGLASALGLEAVVFLAEIDLSAAAAPAPVSFRPIPRFPAASRDLSIVLDPGTPSSSVLEALSRVPAPAPPSFSWIDRYEGAPLETGQVAMTLRVILQPLDRTLTEGEAEAFRAKLVDALERVGGARLRRIDT
jgi:phenylalanyl-tRNA synthetase beta chain